jgi:hypothetical protein
MRRVACLLNELAFLAAKLPQLGVDVCPLGLVLLDLQVETLRLFPILLQDRLKLRDFPLPFPLFGSTEVDIVRNPFSPLFVAIKNQTKINKIK